MPMHMHKCLSNIYLSGVRVRQLSVPDSLGNNGGRWWCRFCTAGINQKEGPSNLIPIKIEAADAMTATDTTRLAANNKTTGKRCSLASLLLFLLRE
jgi:hypothetical protein